MSLLMLLCPVGMAAMGGIAWVLTRLPGKGTGRIARMARRSSCLPLPTSQPRPADDGRQEKGVMSDV
jgi:hypothetical protein